MARTKVTATSTSTVSGKASGRGGRAARATTRKKISYAEQDEDEDEEMDDGEGEGEGEGDTTLVDEEEEEGDDEVPESTFDLAELVKAFSKSRSKKEKTETAKLEKQLEEMLQSANNEVESLTVDAQKKTDATIAPLHLDDARPVSRIEPKGYRSAFTEQHNLTKQLVDALDGYKEELDPANDEFFEAAKQALEARPHQAKRAYKKLVKSTTAVVEERRNMAELHQGAAQETYRHVKALVRL